MTDLTTRVADSRARLNRGERAYDIIVVGGGINGAAVAWLACHNGLKTLLLEAEDFSSGTSSRSSKMIHGGLRYLAKGDWRLTREAARARDALMAHHPDLVQPLPFWFMHPPASKPKPWQVQVALQIYRAFAPGCRPGWLSPEQLHDALPYPLHDIQGASCYFDAISDDCGLITWLLQEAVREGLDLCHYSPVDSLLEKHGRCTGVQARIDGCSTPIHAACVINCAGAWCDRLTPLPGNQVIRPLRGSHLVLPAWRYPAPAALTFAHPEDGRPVYLYPWMGTSIMGTTDLDHQAPLKQDVAMSREEFDYLWQALHTLDPDAREEDIIASWSGVRPVVCSAAEHSAPSDASREHLIWQEPGLVNLTGGKLTTFLETGQQVLEYAAAMIDAPLRKPELPPVSHAPHNDQPIGAAVIGWHRLEDAIAHQAITHLDDLLLRRTRLGLLLGRTLHHYQAPIDLLCRRHLGWSEAQCQQEWDRYWRIWERFYSPQPFRSRHD
ncbi:FAD-dependent oxidoreductase [Ferrimonas sediminicola]|uniref:FAD-dependent oxidoreductase n=1 Tax=Ferrimonas sediminicola TaxID=2569538 RepID=A0A4U1BA64_9GAMM|nr:FAD-dependent oxidoreductase [Ferrimonas sediminicola]TKB47305.1 FAD-dependent oxidoreductase [Ferrimonas sediminicola]